MAGDGDGPEWAVESRPKARKPHKCAECNRQIRPGEHYERVAGVWDGDFAVQLTCAHCTAARRWLDRVCGGWMYGGVLEDLGEHIGEGYGDAPFVYLNELARQDWNPILGRGMPWGTRWPLVPVELVCKLVDESLRYQQAVGHLGRDRWAA